MSRTGFHLKGEVHSPMAEGRRSDQWSIMHAQAASAIRGGFRCHRWSSIATGDGLRGGRAAAGGAIGVMALFADIKPTARLPRRL